jgi:hypothetical protein
MPSSFGRVSLGGLAGGGHSDVADAVEPAETEHRKVVGLPDSKAGGFRLARELFGKQSFEIGSEGCFGKWFLAEREGKRKLERVRVVKIVGTVRKRPLGAIDGAYMDETGAPLPPYVQHA